MRLQLPQMPLKISLIAFSASSILVPVCQATEAHHLGLNSHIAWERFKITLSNKSLEGKKKQESTIGNYVIHNYLSQHSIVIINALKMLSYANLKKKRSGNKVRENTQQKPSFRRQCGMNLEIWFLFLATFWQVTSPVCSHLSSYRDKVLLLQLVRYDLCCAAI